MRAVSYIDKALNKGFKWFWISAVLEASVEKTERYVQSRLEKPLIQSIYTFCFRLGRQIDMPNINSSKMQNSNKNIWKFLNRIIIGNPSPIVTITKGTQYMAGYTGTQNTGIHQFPRFLVVKNSASHKWKCQSILRYLTHFCRPVYRSTFQFWSRCRRGQTNSIQAMRLSRKNSLPSSLIYLDTIKINLETYSTD